MIDDVTGKHLNHVAKMMAVSYTHLDVYKRQLLMGTHMVHTSGELVQFLRNIIVCNVRTVIIVRL